MPDIITHYRLGDAVYARLPQQVRSRIYRPLFDHATAGPDIWYTYRFWNPRLAQDRPERGNIMQQSQTGEFLLALAERTHGPAGDLMFSYLAGFLCHYALDKTTHPYIIYRSGAFDGTPDTLPNRGGHMRLEHAIDLRYLREWGYSMAGAPITRRILRLRRLPEGLEPELDAVYRRVYGWSDVCRELNRGITDQRRFYTLVQDPTGALDAILRRVDRGQGANDLTAMSYHGKGAWELDVCNEAHAPWAHPRDPAIISRESFPELFDRAAAAAGEMIRAAACPAEGSRERLIPVFQSASYETGFGWRDPRNRAVQNCVPLSLGRRGNW